MTAILRHRRIDALEPGVGESCRLMNEDGERRKADTQRLFAAMADQRKDGDTNEWLFVGDKDELWEDVTLFVDEESICCPFYTYEQIEEPDGIRLRVIKTGG